MVIDLASRSHPAVISHFRLRVVSHPQSSLTLQCLFDSSSNHGLWLVTQLWRQSNAPGNLRVGDGQVLVCPGDLCGYTQTNPSAAQVSGKIQSQLIESMVAALRARKYLAGQAASLRRRRR